MAAATFDVDKSTFEAKALTWAQQFEQVCFLQSNGYIDEYSSIESLLAVRAIDTFESTGFRTFEDLQKFKTKHSNNWMLGYFAYDLKNEIENLQTTHSNPLAFPDAYFFVPSIIIKFQDSSITIEAEEPHLLFEQINNTSNFSTINQKINPIKISKRFSREAYFRAFENLQRHIKRGDIYEVNLCQEFFSEFANIDPLAVFQQLNEVSPTPFATFFKINDKYILSASPERFLAKRGTTLISQPIKGTAPRGLTAKDDATQIEKLRNNPKEIAENVMIVDLVRNDLTRAAQPGTVAAERKLEVHTFKQVHQLISTITCEQRSTIDDMQAIKNIFPPGSMTGAPKISAMMLCDQEEAARRGVYAGTVGYFAPNGDFDFNVVIRTILYNKTNKYLSFHTGGAITVDANPEQEYAECLLKATAILKTLQAELV